MHPIGSDAEKLQRSIEIARVMEDIAIRDNVSRMVVYRDTVRQLRLASEQFLRLTAPTS